MTRRSLRTRLTLASFLALCAQLVVVAATLAASGGGDFPLR